LLVDPHDMSALASAMESAISNAQARQFLIDRGLSRAAEFPWDRTALETYRVYASVLEESTRVAKAAHVVQRCQNTNPEPVGSNDANYGS